MADRKEVLAQAKKALAEKKAKRQISPVEIMEREKEKGAKKVETAILRSEDEHELLIRIAKLEQRIDRIVDAHEQCKKLKGL